MLIKHSSVKRAFLALMHDTSVDEKPHLIVGIKADGDIDRVMREAGNVGGDTAPHAEPVELCRMSQGEAGLSDYFLREITPFYERKWGNKLRSFLGLAVRDLARF